MFRHHQSISVGLKDLILGSIKQTQTPIDVNGNWLSCQLKLMGVESIQDQVQNSVKQQGTIFSRASCIGHDSYNNAEKKMISHRKYCTFNV